MEVGVVMSVGYLDRCLPSCAVIAALNSPHSHVKNYSIVFYLDVVTALNLPSLTCEEFGFLS